MQEINSNQNKLFKQIKSLINKKYRQKWGQFIIEGERFIDYALTHDYAIEYICIRQDLMASFSNDEKMALYQKKSKVILLPPNLFDELADTEKSQGIIGVLALPKPVEIENIFERSVLPQLIFLDRLQDPGNVGTIIRTADACGIEYIILNKGTVDPYNSKVVRSTAGSILNVKIIEVEDAPFWLNRLSEQGYTLLVTALHAEYAYDDKSAYGQANCLIIGNEANGVSEQIMRLKSHKIKIPIYGKAESLNASVAAGIMMYKINEYCIQNK
ncbi:TrmH family RNA methyltransferase [Fusibacter ferrireducens]|uniref:RNA methyltransferase n=1 Tax=Fusibacter ferrireducens TaxID=2785058 RepID=A0ABR9ZSF4_9FIRM|nr:RNA methyltransferase [Fusibacter ferrireducens]MBF4692835.1 RNA methyltransferase [Fusibacter ferrireducens]